MTMIARRFLAAVGLAVPVALAAGAAGAEEVLPAYNTYLAVPFVVDKGGLAADTVAYLNARLAGRYRFRLENLPRRRLVETVLVDPAFRGVVLFLNPVFVDDAERQRFQWTVPIFSDANAVVSSTARRIEYAEPASLDGMRFGGILGHRYAGLEERFGTKLQREDVPDELTNLKKIASGRIDVTVMPFTTYRYLIKYFGVEHALINRLHVSERPHARFERMMFVSHADPALARQLGQVADGMRSDPAWKAILARYGID